MVGLDCLYSIWVERGSTAAGAGVSGGDWREKKKKKKQMKNRKMEKKRYIMLGY